MKNEFIDVLMPAYNAEKYVKLAVQSILNQDYENIRLIIINDGSTDNTEKIVNSIKDERINLYSNKVNKGLTQVRNQLLKLATNKYIAFQDADDISYPNRLSTQMRFLKENPNYDMVCSNAISIDARSRQISEKWWNVNNLPISWLLLWGNPIATSTVLLNRNILLKYKLKFRQYSPAEDYDLWCRFAAVSNIYRFEAVLLKYRVHKHSSYQKEKNKAMSKSLASNKQYVKNYATYTPKFQSILTLFTGANEINGLKEYNIEIIDWYLLIYGNWKNKHGNIFINKIIRKDIKVRIRDMISHSQINLKFNMIPYIIKNFVPIDYCYLLLGYFRKNV